MFNKAVVALSTVMLVSQVACVTEEVELQGVVTLDGPSSQIAAANVGVSVLEGDGTHFSSTTSDENGLFRTSAPSGEAVHIVIEDNEGALSSFRGVSGMNPRASVPVGFTHTFGVSAMAEWNDRFENCPNFSEGGMIIGQVVIDLLAESGELPVAHAASVTVFNEFGEELVSGCYLNGSGSAVDPDAEYVGNTGYFAAFGLPTGRLILRVSLELIQDEIRLYEYDVFMPENGAAPRFPILLPFEL